MVGGVNPHALGGGGSVILLGERIFFTGWREPEEWFWWFEHFSKLKTAFCEYWTSLKIKINMACMCKESEIKTKIVEEPMFAAKNDISIGFLILRVGDWFLEGGGIIIWYRGGGAGVYWGYFSRWGEMSKFLTGGEGLPPVGKTLYTAFEFQL